MVTTWPEKDILKVWHANLTTVKGWGGCWFVCAWWRLFALQLIRLALPCSTSNRGKECGSSSTVLVFLCVRGVAGSLCAALPPLLMTDVPPRCHLSRWSCWYCNGERLQTNWSCSDLICLGRFTAYSRGFTLHSSLCSETIISVKDDSDKASPALTETIRILLIKPYYKTLFNELVYYTVPNMSLSNLVHGIDACQLHFYSCFLHFTCCIYKCSMSQRMNS